MFERDYQMNKSHYNVLRTLSPHCHSYLEIGVREGGSLQVVLESPSIQKITLCDDWGSDYGGTGRGSPDHIVNLLDKLTYKGQVQILSGRSQEMIPTIDQSFDLTMVDGSHSYDDALSDLCNTWPLTNKYMVVHDAFFTPVLNAIRSFGEMLTIGRVELYFGDTGTMVFYKPGVRQ